MKNIVALRGFPLISVGVSEGRRVGSGLVGAAVGSNPVSCAFQTPRARTSCADGR